MISASHFRQLQQLFFQKAGDGRNPSVVQIETLKIPSTEMNRFTKFTGDNRREVDKTVVVKCLYKRDLTDKQREKAGVSIDVNCLIFISPLALKVLYPTGYFPDYVMNAASNIRLKFDNQYLEIENIKPLEPQFVGRDEVCLCYQIATKGVTNFD